MIWLVAMSLIGGKVRADTPPPTNGVAQEIATTRAGISSDDRLQREAMAHLFVLNKSIKSLADKQKHLSDRYLAQEAVVRGLAQDVDGLEQRAKKQESLLNKRLRQIYQEP